MISCQLLVVTIWNNIKQEHLKEKQKAFRKQGKHENDVLFSNDTGILGKRNSEFSQQESNLRPSDYQFGLCTTELQETRGS